MDFSKIGLTLPALRGTQGQRTMFLTLPQNGTLASLLPSTSEPLPDRSQRDLDPKHAREIADYIGGNRQDFALGALTYATDIEGEFEEIQPGSQIGILRLPLTAKLRSIDGQHRREGIRLALDVIPELESQNIAVLIYEEPDLVLRRQMFSDMNNTARRVAKAVNVAFDNRDPFARVSTELARNHALLAGRVESNSARINPGSGDLYTLGAIHDAVKRLFVGPSGRVRDPYKFDFQAIEDRAEHFFDMLAVARPELSETSARETSILFSSTTLRVVAGAVWSVVFAPEGPAVALAQVGLRLSQVDFHPTAVEWLDCGFVTPGRSTPNARSQEVSAATTVLIEQLTKDSTGDSSSE